MNTSGYLVVFHLDERQFALPLEAVDRVVRAVEITPLPASSPSLLGVINVRGRVYPVINLRRACRLPEREIGATDQFIIVNTASRSVVLPVDQSEVVSGSPESLGPASAIGAGADDARVLKRAGGLVPIYDLESFIAGLEKTEPLPSDPAALQAVVPIDGTPASEQKGGVA